MYKIQLISLLLHVYTIDTTLENGIENGKYIYYILAAVLASVVVTTFAA